MLRSDPRGGDIDRNAHDAGCFQDNERGVIGSGPDRAARNHKADDDDGDDNSEGPLPWVDAWMSGQIEKVAKPPECRVNVPDDRRQERDR